MIYSELMLLGPDQEQSINALNALVSAVPVLADVTKPTTVSAGASSYGLSGVLLQKQHGQKWKQKL